MAIRKTSAAFAAVATAGVSSLVLGAAPASAATVDCGVGTLVAPGICEVTFTAGTGSFTPTAQMTQLEVLLVGAGGNGASQFQPNTSGYAAAGGGGEVKVVDFAGATAPFAIVVPESGVPGSVTSGALVATVNNGVNGTGGAGGASGNGNSGVAGGTGQPTPWGAGGGAGGAADGSTNVTAANGGAGVVVNTLALPTLSLFSGDTTCYGGGGAIGSSGAAEVPGDPPIPAVPAVQGTPGCGGGAPTDLTGTALAAPVANSGGGAGGVSGTVDSDFLVGANGFVAIRWNAPTLAATGAPVNMVPLTIGVAGLLAGAGLSVLAASGRRRKRSS